jgi:hypothetical protein
VPSRYLAGLSCPNIAAATGLASRNWRGSRKRRWSRAIRPCSPAASDARWRIEHPSSKRARRVPADHVRDCKPTHQNRAPPGTQPATIREERTVTAISCRFEPFSPNSSRATQLSPNWVLVSTHLHLPFGEVGRGSGRVGLFQWTQAFVFDKSDGPLRA